MCTGCGACAYVDPNALRMLDTLDYGRRPFGTPGTEPSPQTLNVCPGIGLTHEGASDSAIRELLPAWGPVLEVWEGFAVDPTLRHSASSGGIASALALFGVEEHGFAGVLHIRARTDFPYLNETVLSNSRTEILAATGSRYAPASPCDGLGLVETAEGPCVFIGKPCDVAATQLARRLRPRLDNNLAATIAIFCAGTPSTRGTFELLKHLGITNPNTISRLQYRGFGWPGGVVVQLPTGEPDRRMSYGESWGLLQRYRQWRCYVCADHSGEFADIAVGDPWYREVLSGEPGRSLVLVRTERGRALLRAAQAAHYVQLEPVSPSVVSRSQPELLRVRGAIWGRISTLRLLGAYTPKFGGFPSWRFWLSELTVREKLQSVYGTIKRVFTKRLLRPVHVEPLLYEQAPPCASEQRKPGAALSGQGSPPSQCSSQ